MSGTAGIGQGSNHRVPPVVLFFLLPIRDVSFSCCSLMLLTPRHACAAKGLSDCSWTGLYIYIRKKKIETQKILTFRTPFQHRKASLGI